MRKTFTHWAKTLRNDPSVTREITQAEAHEMMLSYMTSEEFRHRKDTADMEHPVRCGIWHVWGWRYR